MGTPAGAEKVGGDLYLFRSKTEDKTCVIDAHGGFMFENRSFRVPDGVTLKFYAHHGNSLADTGRQALKFVRDAYASVEELKGGDICYNYLLSKAWGKHTFGEDEEDKRITYERARELIEDLDARRTRQKERLGDPSDLTASLVTIRNRWDILCGIPLKDVIHDVRKVMPTLTTFHCSFCRTAMLGLPGQTEEGAMETARLA